jgi:hypothetical protein
MTFTLVTGHAAVFAERNARFIESIAMRLSVVGERCLWLVDLWKGFWNLQERWQKL